MRHALIVVALLLVSAFALAGDDQVTQVTFRVSGNCGMCKTRIEKALSISEVKFAKWDKTTKMAKVAYRSAAVSLDSLKRRIAAVGHDADPFRAPDAVYSALPGCCLYRDKNATH